MTLDDLLYGVRTVLAAGVEAPLRGAINLIGGITIVDNPAEDRLDITITGTGQLPQLELLNNSPPAATLGEVVVRAVGGALQAISPAGVVHSFAAGSGTATARRIETIAGPPVPITTATLTTLYSYVVPLHSTVELDISITGLRADESAASGFRYICRAARAASAPFGSGTVGRAVVTGDDGIGSTTVSITLDATSIVIAVTPAAVAAHWCVLGEARVYTP
jgi:hypothetical protein